MSNNLMMLDELLPSILAFGELHTFLVQNMNIAGKKEVIKKPVLVMLQVGNKLAG